jgi:serine/threonine-protein kinase HipA
MVVGRRALKTLAEVKLWGRTIGAVALVPEQDYAAFEYTPEFAASGIEVSPITMPLAARVYEFPELSRRSFHGLPGLLSDSLPDRFGNALIDAWLASEGRTPESFGAVERLCYTGVRGMGALEYQPALSQAPRASTKIRIDALVSLATEVLTRRAQLVGSFRDAQKAAALADILRVGTSAGGARAKAVIAWNPETNEVRSGQVPAGEGFGYWLLKFDGVGGNKDKELEDPEGFCAIEYAYSLMAKSAGVTMSECRLLEEGGRRHFMAKRFDRVGVGEKLHMQSLGALAHYDYNEAGSHSYEQAFGVMRQLRLPMAQVEQQFRRMVFNVVARNQDDHVKNIAFLMKKTGRWALSPAFDVTYSYSPTGLWTSRHQMSINGKRDAFTLEDMKACARVASLGRGRAETMVREVTAAVANWSECAERAGVAPKRQKQIAKTHRLVLPKR